MAKPETINDFANSALDALYAKTAGQMLVQIGLITNSPRSLMQKRLRELQVEANKLDEADERMKFDNPVLQQTLQEYDSSLNTTNTLIAANDDIIQNAGKQVAVPAVTAKVFLGFSSQLVSQGIDPVSDKGFSTIVNQVAAGNIPWNVPPSVLDFAVDYVDSSEWLFKMEGWGSGYSELTKGTILKGINEGWGPNYTAAQMRLYAENIPKSAAENLTRTLQLTSYRDASVAMEELNGKFIVKKIRVASLDERTCLACISLHGTELAPGQRVDDHYRGRCTEFYVVPGGATSPAIMQADSKPGERNFVPYQSGEGWFNSLPESRQKAQASFASTPAKFRAFQDGTKLSEFVGEHNDPVFGNQFIENSLKKAIGDEAAKGLYTVNQ